ncbi:uncharacterized protein [Temnothorax longispinosus]|uniref:uncharacterized protein n=1 Tax=Temnothorax longispinosus TaxID=300112 RepID=UPI003A9A017F
MLYELHKLLKPIAATRLTGPVAAMQAEQQTSDVDVSTSNLPTPGAQTPPAHVLQLPVVKQVQNEPARRQALQQQTHQQQPGQHGGAIDGQPDLQMECSCECSPRITMIENFLLALCKTIDDQQQQLTAAIRARAAKMKP